MHFVAGNGFAHMILDARTLEPDAELQADICIVGSGPAGMAIALDYDGLPLRVLMLESGGFEEEKESMSLSKLASGSYFGTVTDVGAYRLFGGTANAWSIETNGTRRNLRLVPMTAADFEPRAWMKESGWPVGIDYFNGYIERAKAFFGLPKEGFTPEEWSDADTPALPLKSDRIRTSMFMFADADLLRLGHRQTIERSRNVTTYLYATAMELEVDEIGKRVASLRCASEPGRQFRVRADQIILATGGLWATQLLMASNSRIKAGLGNAGDHLGRHFNDHPMIEGGMFHPTSPDWFDRMKLYDMRPVRGTPVMAHLQLTDEALRRENVLNLSMNFFPVEKNVEAHRNMTARQKAGFEGALKVRWALRMRKLPDPNHMRDMLLGFDGVLKRGIDRLFWPKSHIGRGGWADLPNLSKRYERFEIFHQSEQSPHPDSRITLSDERDRLGQRRILIDWKYHQSDIDALKRSQLIFKEELAKNGVGRFDILWRDDKPVFVHSSTNHFMGITRMSHTEADGVVDTDCRVHGVDNLFVAASSVFPTGGFANPTLSIVALAHRVGDHVRSLWERSPRSAANDANAAPVGAVAKA